MQKCRHTGEYAVWLPHSRALWDGSLACCRKAPSDDMEVLGVAARDLWRFMADRVNDLFHKPFFLHNIGPVCRFSFPWTNPMKWRATICQIDPDWRLWKVYSCTWQCFCRYESKEKSWICQNLHIIWHITNQSSCNTSSAAQGGGGSFKNRKPIGAVGCCEARMAERSHWWIERWLISLTLSLSFFYLSISLSVCLSIYLLAYLQA